ncbi:hypothetical protein DH2020_026969 [Rehmannia glutinosa]|uniref:Uncharacterized protein n=1 Tax=Rehmannia glutinosa TaxID=99300 RepID=A0ABR0VY88_REHGL
MNFLMLRNNQTAAQEPQSVKESRVEPNYVSKAGTTLEGLISEDPFPQSTPSETSNAESNEFGDENGRTAVSSENSNFQVDSHIDVTEDAGLIIIPYNKAAISGTVVIARSNILDRMEVVNMVSDGKKVARDDSGSEEVPDNWTEAPDILSFRSMDRSFVFPGEQIRILACLSAYKQDTEIITPFKVAAVMNKNGIGESSKKQNGNIEGETNPVTQTARSSSADQDNQHGETVMKGKIDSLKDVSTGESLLRMEDHRRQTEQLLQRFKNSHFFARIAESNEPLWSKRRAQEASLKSSAVFEEQLTGNSSETAMTMKKKNPVSAAIDRGHFDARTSGGLARGAVKCSSLSNGDIVVLLQVNVGVQFVTDPILEILQFEKYQERKLTLENQDIPTALNQDPYGELLKWLLPLENSIPPAARPVSPPILSTSSKDWDQFSFKKFVESGKSGKEGLLSFRGVPLQQERFSVRCGLEGIFTPGRRWRRKIELIQPVEIHSFSVDCNTDDLLCVHVKNVSPAHTPDIVVFIDAITIVFEEASKGGPPLFLPIASVESGSDYSLPNLALRRGEEHSFILKPATTLWKNSKGHIDSNPRPSRLPAGNAASTWHHSSNTEGKHSGSPSDQYAVLVSCRCNYTESKLFFKQPTSWRPRISRDLMISVASEMSTQTLGSDGTQLPVQVLTLQASNMTSENLTLIVRAPASFTSPPSVVPLSSSPSSPLSPFSTSAGLAEGLNSDRQGSPVYGLSSVSLNQGEKVEDGPASVSINDRTVPISDVPKSDLGCTHLWLQSRVPLGCVPSQSTATVKLEVLPLTDGIITLDSLQIERNHLSRTLVRYNFQLHLFSSHVAINVVRAGLTYIPEQSLKINATSSIATGIF